MGWIILLIVLGILLFIAELVLLPGLTVAAIGSFCSLVFAVALAFTNHGAMVGWMVLAIVLVILAILVAIFLRTPTWKNIALKANVTEPLACPKASIGEIGRAVTRLAPMGKVMIGDTIIEAKTMGEYVDEGSTVEVIGTDNMNIIVKLK